MMPGMQDASPSRDAGLFKRTESPKVGYYLFEDQSKTIVELTHYTLMDEGLLKPHHVMMAVFNEIGTITGFKVQDSFNEKFKNNQVTHLTIVKASGESQRVQVDSIEIQTLTQEETLVLTQAIERLLSAYQEAKDLKKAALKRSPHPKQASGGDQSSVAAPQVKIKFGDILISKGRKKTASPYSQQAQDKVAEYRKEEKEKKAERRHQKLQHRIIQKEVDKQELKRDNIKRDP